MSQSADDTEPLVSEEGPNPFQDNKTEEDPSSDDETPKTFKEKVKKTVKKLKIDNPVLVVYLVLLIIVGTGNKIMLKIQTVPLTNYPYYLSQLTTVIYLPIFFGIVLTKLLFTDHIPNQIRNFPKYKFLLMGTFDAVAGVLLLFGTTHISGPLSVLLAQGVIPVTMVMSKLFIRGTKYKLFEYIGAAIIFIGIFVTLAPLFFGGSKGGGSDGGTESGVMGLVWAIVFFSANIPTAGSSVYKEIAFKGVSMDVFYLASWVAFFQFLVGIPLAIPSAPAQGTSIKEIPESLAQGFLCWLIGRNSNPGDHCKLALAFNATYMTFNVMYNFLLLSVLKKGSAALMFIASAVVIPAANIIFALPFLGPYRAPLHWEDIVGLFVILAGLILYRVAPGLKKKDKEELEGGNAIPSFGLAGATDTVQPTYLASDNAKPRTSSQIRGTFYSRLGIPPPMHPQE
eukprot:gb/GECH01003395.1/.p1 GENE.gb/GECH01003395.1/~~gb/GECH01003395.1/.p1  ORF type:complete len:454 (+),score=87.03 gb/GECH01003395.1/:1-1362(+)